MADNITFNKQQEYEFYIRLAKKVSAIHKIPIKNFGYIGEGVADYDSILSFFEDEFDNRSSDLVEMKVYTEIEIRIMKALFFDVLVRFNDLPSVLCHGDLSKKNIIIRDNGDIVLIDWDDAMAYNWMADISRFTFWMKMNYNNSDYNLFRNTFFEYYQTDYRKSEFDTFEKAFHIYVALDSLAYFMNKSDDVMVFNIKRYLRELLI